MRKFITMILCVVSVTTFGQLKLGIEGGYNISQFSQKGSNQQYYDLSNINGFNVGIVAEEKLRKHFFLQTGLSFTEKGSEKITTSYANSGASTTIKLNYLELPLNLVYKLKLNHSVTALLGAGFYGAMGISGTEKGANTIKDPNTGTIVPVSEINNKVKFSNNTTQVDNNITYVEPIDMGYNVLAGLEWKNFQFKASLNNGFTSIYPTGSTTFHNNVYSFSIAYLMPWN
jgi:hypothetical protein